MKRHVQDLLRQTVGHDVTVDSLRRIAGGDINEPALAETTGGPIFVKWNRGSHDDLFVREAEQLRRMRRADTSLVIPEPIAAVRPDGDRPAMLLLEYLDSGPKVDDFDERLGRGLAELHEHTSKNGFGFDHDNYCGETPQPNGWTDDWVSFYREKRLRHQLKLAVDGRSVSQSDRRAYERLLDRLDAIIGIDPEPPALIHGDLWSGNLHTAPDGRPALIDPAAYFGHREAELGMMELFGGYSPTVYRAYREYRPLQEGWRDRLPVYKLYHLMNHYNLFGGHWGGQAFDLVRQLS